MLIHPPSHLLIRRWYSSRIIPFILHLRGYHSLWHGFPTNFGSNKGYPHHICLALLQGIRFDLSGVQSPLLTGSRLFSFPPPTKMLHFRGFVHTFIQGVLSRISGSQTACVYPEHIAAYRATLCSLAKSSTIWRKSA